MGEGGGGGWGGEAALPCVTRVGGSGGWSAGVSEGGVGVGLPTLPEWAGDSRNSSQSPARGWPRDANLPEFRCPECQKMCFILIFTLLLTVHGLISL